MPSSHLILCHPLYLLPQIPPSIRVFSNESTICMRWPKYWSFSFSIIPSQEIPGLISFRMDWLDLLAVQGTFKSLLQHHRSKASILRHSAFFPVQLSHPYMTTGKTIALTRWNFVGKVMSLLLNMLSRLVITFLPRSKRLLISWLQSPSAVILEPRKVIVMSYIYKLGKALQMRYILSHLLLSVFLWTKCSSDCMSYGWEKYKSFLAIWNVVTFTKSQLITTLGCIVYCEKCAYMYLLILWIVSVLVISRYVNKLPPNMGA